MSTSTIAIGSIALAIAVIHVLTNGRYGFHRDELQVLSDALHLDWGFVPYPPFTPFVERIAMSLFGLSLVGLRMFSVIAQSAAIIIAGLIARELGGGLWAQVTAAVGVAVAPLSLFEGTEFQYTTFDYLWWVLAAYFVVRLLKSGDARWCLAIGATVGVGVMTKYTMVFYASGIVLGMVLTNARRFLGTRWFWIGAGLALLICLPNVIWQIRHDFVSVHFLQYIHHRDVGEGRAEGFWHAQAFLDVNRYSFPLWTVGLAAFFTSRRYRMLAVMYLIPVIFFWLSKGRGYYTGAAYPMLMAMGAVTLESWLRRLRPRWRLPVEIIYIAVLLGWGVHVTRIIVPWAASGPLRDDALANNSDLREEIGWDELVKTVAHIRDLLPTDQQQNLGIIVGNYGEQGAIEILGRAYHLPPPISGTNSAWYRSYPKVPPKTVIVIGANRSEVDSALTSCRVAGHNTNSLGIENEESKDHPDIFVCGESRIPWPELWKRIRGFG